MKNTVPFSEDTMWRAAVSCDPDYDGLFFYAVRTTGIFCRPSCRSKTPVRKNISFFFKAEEAEKAGYRPCKRCQPMAGVAAYDPNAQIVRDAQVFLQQNYHRKTLLRDLALAVGMSRYHLNRIFKERTGETPRMYVERIRTHRAKHLLSTTSLNVAEIGFRAGFQSLSRFYEVFHQHTGCSPTVYRKEGGS